VLVKKGYTVRYTEVAGGEHGFMHWRALIGDGLIFLTSGWSNPS
jgi:enterochelin esterase-like enzyme